MNTRKRLVDGIGRIWHWIVRGVIILFVSWHLFALLVRNPMDLWEKGIERWAKEQPWWEDWGEIWEETEKVTRRYCKLTGCEQGWSMFTPNLARSAPFLAARIVFDDGSDALLLSPGEPDPKGYFRLSGSRLRKLETAIYGTKPDEIATSEDYPLFQQYVRWCLRRWRSAHLDDTRIPVRVEVLKRRFTFPTPEEDPKTPPSLETTVLGTFDTQGNLI